jgi:hypothetical protein
MIVNGHDIDLNRATFSLSQRGILLFAPWLVKGIRPAIAAARRARKPPPVEITAQDDGRGHRLTGAWPLVATVGVDGRVTFAGHGGGVGQTTIPSASPETITRVGGVAIVLGTIAIFWMMGKAATAEKNTRRRRETRLDQILDQVKARRREVTIDAEGYTPAQIDRIYDAARARGLDASGTNRFILIRDLRAPCSAGWVSYRYRGPYGWIEICANDDDDALREAKRSTNGPVSRSNLQVWNGREYESVAGSTSARR